MPILSSDAVNRFATGGPPLRDFVTFRPDGVVSVCVSPDDSSFAPPVATVLPWPVGAALFPPPGAGWEPDVPVTPAASFWPLPPLHAPSSRTNAIRPAIVRNRVNSFIPSSPLERLRNDLQSKLGVRLGDLLRRVLRRVRIQLLREREPDGHTDAGGADDGRCEKRIRTIEVAELHAALDDVGEYLEVAGADRLDFGGLLFGQRMHLVVPDGGKHRVLGVKANVRGDDGSQLVCRIRPGPQESVAQAVPVLFVRHDDQVVE